MRDSEDVIDVLPPYTVPHVCSSNAKAQSPMMLRFDHGTSVTMLTQNETDL